MSITVGEHTSTYFWGLGKRRKGLQPKEQAVQAEREQKTDPPSAPETACLLQGMKYRPHSTGRDPDELHRGGGKRQGGRDGAERGQANWANVEDQAGGAGTLLTQAQGFQRAASALDSCPLMAVMVRMAANCPRQAKGGRQKSASFKSLSK